LFVVCRRQLALLSIDV